MNIRKILVIGVAFPSIKNEEYVVHSFNWGNVPNNLNIQDYNSIFLLMNIVGEDDKRDLIDWKYHNRIFNQTVLYEFLIAGGSIFFVGNAFFAYPSNSSGSLFYGCRGPR